MEQSSAMEVLSGANTEAQRRRHQEHNASCLDSTLPALEIDVFHFCNRLGGWRPHDANLAVSVLQAFHPSRCYVRISQACLIQANVDDSDNIDMSSSDKCSCRD